MTRRFLLLVAAALALAASPPSHAQEPNPPAARNGKPLAQILAGINRTAGLIVVADSSLTDATAPALKAETTAQNIEDQLDLLIKSLPAGTLWAKLMLPAPPAGRTYRGDDIAEFALAQAKLFGSAGAVTPGKVEVLGQKLAEEKAHPVVEALGLKPVYVLSNPATRSAKATGEDFSAMTDEQRQAWAQQQAQQILNMSPDQRQQYLQNFIMQQGMVMGVVMRQLSPDDRRKMFEGIAGFGQSFRVDVPAGPGGL
jgi:hypothetical protein